MADFGMLVLSDGQPSVDIDLVFVHGLRGHRIRTWEKTGIVWPRDLLPKEEALEHVRIMTVSAPMIIHPSTIPNNGKVGL